MGMDLFPRELYLKIGKKETEIAGAKTHFWNRSELSVLYNTNAWPSLSNTGPHSPSLPGDIGFSSQIRSKKRWDNQRPSGVEGSSAPLVMIKKKKHPNPKTQLQHDKTEKQMLKIFQDGPRGFWTWLLSLTLASYTTLGDHSAYMSLCPFLWLAKT